MMNSIEIKDVSHELVQSRTDVSIGLELGEINKLRDALTLIQKYQKIALNAFKKQKGYCPTKSDWHNIQYAVKNDRIIVQITDGMAG